MQSRAQQELDTVIGSARLPDFQDRDSLPYIGAIVKEVLRYFACHLDIGIYLSNLKMESSRTLGFVNVEHASHI